MKTKFFLFLLTSFLSFYSCSKQPKCNDEEVQKAVIETLSKQILDNVEKQLKTEEMISDKDYKSYLPIIMANRKYFNELELKLFNFRTTDVNKEIQKCNCEAELSVLDKATKDLSDI